jgi:flavodoxin/Pyruvate/2-oxoacid:ferredoxin oxidoreductase delta subunit
MNKSAPTPTLTQGEKERYPHSGAKIDLYYFSGTGNTQTVAQFIAQAFERHQFNVELVRIEDVLQGRTQVQHRDADLVGVGYPILGFGMPPIVAKLIARLAPGRDQRAFVFMTASDIVAPNNGAAKRAVKALKQKGYDAVYERIICMACNWAVKYPDALNKELYYTAAIKAENLCQEVLAGKTRTLRIAPITRAIMALAHAGEKLGARFFGRMLAVSEACTHCHRCIDDCPAGNIHLHEETIRFGWDCLWCMRCIYACPQRAISPRLFKWCVLGDGYDLQATIDNPDIPAHFVSEKTRGYFRHFVPYVRQPER